MTTGTPFTVVQARLSTSATDLLDRMVELHLAAPRGSQQEFQWIRSQAWGGGGGIERLYWLGDRSEVEFTSNDFQDLLEAGLVRRSTNSGRNTYRLPNDAVRFYRWRLEKAGPAPIQQMEAAVRSLLDDPAKLGRRHPEAARHLAAAFEWLWTDPLDDNALIETGGSLRSALTALTADLVGRCDVPRESRVGLEAVAQRARAAPTSTSRRSRRTHRLGGALRSTPQPPSRRTRERRT